LFLPVSPSSREHEQGMLEATITPGRSPVFLNANQMAHAVF